MIVLVWSERGLHDLFKQRELRSLQVEILCIVETRVKEENAMRIHQNIVFGWGFINNYSSVITSVEFGFVGTQSWSVPLPFRYILKLLSMRLK